MFNLQHLEEFTDKEFEDFCKFIYDNFGINLTDKKRSLVHNRLRKRIVALNYSRYNDYFQFAKSHQGKEELVNLINAITTNVTTFFRDPKQFQTFSQLVLPYFESSPKKINIWSAGCSTGEEPYSIAIEILKYAKDFNFQITATDLSTKVLEIAQNGVYSYEQVKTVQPQYLTEFFTQKGDMYEVKPVVKKYVKFSRLNLVEDIFPKGQDIIFCRNVVIYFDKETKDKLYKNFFNSMNKEAFLFVGHSESLFSNNLFKFFRPSVYKRVDRVEDQ